MGPAILSNTGAGVWRKAPMAFPYSSSVLDKVQSATDKERRGATVVVYYTLGVFQRPLTLIPLQKYRDTNGRRIVIQIGGV